MIENVENVESKNGSEESVGKKDMVFRSSERAFGTILVDHPKAKSQAKIFKAVKRPDRIKDMPRSFDGRIVWRTYLTKIQDQGACGNCWAVASTAVLSDRFAIYSANQINTNLSSLNATVCSEVISDTPEFDPKVISQKNLKGHSIAACNGNTIFAALRFLHVFGAMEEFCSSRAFLRSRGIEEAREYRSINDIPMCQDLYGKTFDQCIAGNIAARYFRSKGSYTIPNKIELIKEDIYQFGPNISGFIIYSDFMDNYDGKSIYMGPSKDAEPQGGHAIRVVGWGEELVNNEVVPYWWIANSWGENWGLGGYFKMKMGIKECELEDNFAGLIPDIKGLKLPDYVFFEDTPEDIEKRRNFNVNNENGYLLLAEKKIFVGQLKGLVRPFIENKEKLLDLKTSYAANVPSYLGPYQSKIFFTIDEAKYIKIVHYKTIIAVWLAMFLIFLYFRRRKELY